MKVKSYWIAREHLRGQAHVGAQVSYPDFTTGTVAVLGTVAQVDPERGALVQLTKPIPWQALEQWGVGFSQFEDTED